MASANLLEEALSTDVDESAVSAIVGSLETQLGSTNPSGAEETERPSIVHQNHVNTAIANGGKTSAIKHGVSNGASETVDVASNPDANKSDSVEHENVPNNDASAVRSVTPTGAYANQVTSNLGFAQSNVATVNKTQDGIKIAYSNNQQAGTNAISRILTTQAVTLPNGTVGLSPSNAVQTSSGSVQTVVSTNATVVNKPVVNSIMDQAKSTATAVVIKSAPNSSSQGVSPLPAMTLSANPNSAGVPGIVTLSKPLNQAVANQQTTTAIVGGTPTQILQPNVQILNMNALRPGTPTQAGAKSVHQRVVIGGPQVVGNRPVQPGQITLQTFQGLAPGTQGHLLLKTENGQYQLLRVGPAPTASPANQTPTNATPFRVIPQTGQAVQTTQQVPVLSTQNAPATVSAASNAQAAKIAADNQTKEKCRKFLANLLELSSREPKPVERNVRSLIQDLINAKVEPEQFCERLEKLLNASPQPCLIGFLRKSLPLLRQSMVNKELLIDGICPPPPSVLFQTATTTPTLATPQSIQVRTAAVQMNTASQMRVITQPSSVRPGQTIQHRIITMTQTSQNVAKSVTNAVRVASGAVNTTSMRPTVTTVRTPSGPQAVTLRPGPIITRPTTIQRPQTATVIPNTAVKTTASPLVSASTTLHHDHILSKLQQHTALAKDKKAQIASGVYTGDDDINDVAAMGGVNLAEESQRILGSTDFVGTQIRSCKDELFLRSDALVHKIAQIVAKHKLEEPNSDVAALISHATQERLKTLVEKLAIIAEHRIDMNKFDSRYEITQDVRSQLKCLEEIDKAERKRHEEQEREVLMRAAKSRTKPEDPEQAKLKAKAKEMQKAEMEELRQRDANITALQAIGPRKKLKLDDSSIADGISPVPTARPTVGPKPRIKRVTMRDMIFLLEQEKESRRSNLLFKAYFK